MLPAYPWSQRPDDHPLTLDEVSAALVEASGDVTAAADRLRVGSLTLRKFIERSPRARAVVLEMDHRLADRARRKLIAILNADEDARRQDWAIRYILNSRMARHLGFSGQDDADSQANQRIQNNNFVLGPAGWANGEMFAPSPKQQAQKLIELAPEPSPEVQSSTASK
jgi:hypothetical protein